MNSIIKLGLLFIALIMYSCEKQDESELEPYLSKYFYHVECPNKIKRIYKSSIDNIIYIAAEAENSERKYFYRLKLPSKSLEKIANFPERLFGYYCFTSTNEYSLLIAASGVLYQYRTNEKKWVEIDRFIGMSYLHPEPVNGKLIMTGINGYCVYNPINKNKVMFSNSDSSIILRYTPQTTMSSMGETLIHAGRSNEKTSSFVAECYKISDTLRELWSFPLAYDNSVKSMIKDDKYYVLNFSSQALNSARPYRYDMKSLRLDSIDLNPVEFGDSDRVAITPEFEVDDKGSIIWSDSKNVYVIDSTFKKLVWHKAFRNPAIELVNNYIFVLHDRSLNRAVMFDMYDEDYNIVFRNVKGIDLFSVIKNQYVEYNYKLYFPKNLP